MGASATTQNVRPCPGMSHVRTLRARRVGPYLGWGALTESTMRAVGVPAYVAYLTSLDVPAAIASLDSQDERTWPLTLLALFEEAKKPGFPAQFWFCIQFLGAAYNLEPDDQAAIRELYKRLARGRPSKRPLAISRAGVEKVLAIEASLGPQQWNDERRLGRLLPNSAVELAELRRQRDVSVLRPARMRFYKQLALAVPVAVVAGMALVAATIALDFLDSLISLLPWLSVLAIAASVYDFAHRRSQMVRARQPWTFAVSVTALTLVPPTLGVFIVVRLIDSVEATAVTASTVAAAMLLAVCARFGIRPELALGVPKDASVVGAP